MLIDEILKLRRVVPAYDEELWAFVDQAGGLNLINLTDADLHDRLTQIDKNILYLDSGRTPRDELSADRGWLSPDFSRSLSASGLRISESCFARTTS